VVAAPQKITLGKEVTTVQCRLCNEHIDDVDVQFNGVVEIEGEYWHGECFSEYFGEVLDVA